MVCYKKDKRTLFMKVLCCETWHFSCTFIYSSLTKVFPDFKLIMEKKFARRTIFDKPEKTVDISKYTASLQRLKIYEEKQLQENTTEFDIQTRRKKELHDQIVKFQEDFQTDTLLIKMTCEKSIKKMGNCLAKSGKSLPTSEADLFTSNSLNYILQSLLSEDKEGLINRYETELNTKVAIYERQLKTLEKQCKDMNTTSPEAILLSENYMKLKEQYDNLSTYIQTGAEFDMNEAKNKINELQKSIKSMSNEINITKEKLQKQDEDETTNGIDIFASLKEYLSQLRSESVQTNDEIASLQTSINDNTKELDQVNKEVMLLEQEISNITQELLPQ